MNIRIAKKDEIDLLLEMRMEFIHDILPEYDIQKLVMIKNGTREYIQEHMQKNMLVGFFGEVDNKLVCTTSLLIYNYPPLYSGDYRKIGHVLNFYTRKKYRNNGYGFKLMEYIKNYAKEKNMSKLDLSATEEGYPLYKKSGFIDSVRSMELTLTI